MVKVKLTTGSEKGSIKSYKPTDLERYTIRFAEGDLVVITKATSHVKGEQCVVENANWYVPSCARSVPRSLMN